MIGRSLNIYRIKFVVMASVLVFLCVLSTVAQPTSLRQSRSKQMTQKRLEKIDEITKQIRNNSSNIALYKERSEIYRELLELNFDNNDWFVYADKLESDLSRLVDLEGTAEDYYRRGDWLVSRLLYSTPLYPYPAPNKISELYPDNRYVDAAASDFLKALRLTSDPQEIQSYYTNLSIIYSTRPRLVVSAPDFPKWKDKIPIKLIQKDFEMSIKYSQLALEAGESLPFTDTLKKNLVSTYLTNAETATKLGDSATALKFTQAAQKYRQ